MPPASRVRPSVANGDVWRLSIATLRHTCTPRPHRAAGARSLAYSWPPAFARLRGLRVQAHPDRLGHLSSLHKSPRCGNIRILCHASDYIPKTPRACQPAERRSFAVRGRLLPRLCGLTPLAEDGI